MNTMVVYNIKCPFFSTNDLVSGESVLHIAIVNEEPATVKFLLDAGVDFTQRCCGKFFCPEDQKSSR